MFVDVMLIVLLLLDGLIVFQQGWFDVWVIYGVQGSFVWLIGVCVFVIGKGWLLGNYVVVVLIVVFVDLFWVEVIGDYFGKIVWIFVWLVVKFEIWVVVFVKEIGVFEVIWFQ